MSISSDPSRSLFKRNLAFYWAPWWKGPVWLIGLLALSDLCKLGTTVYGTIINGSPLSPHLTQIPAMLLNPYAWLGVLLAWRTLRTIEWQDVDPAATGRRRFFSWFTANAMSLFLLIFVAQCIEGAIFLISWLFDPIYEPYNPGSHLTFIISMMILGSLVYAYVISLAATLSVFLRHRLIHRGRERLTAIILPGFFSVLCSVGLFDLGMYSIIYLGGRYGLNISPIFDLYIYQALIWTLISIVLVFIATRFAGKNHAIKISVS